MTTFIIGDPDCMYLDEYGAGYGTVGGEGWSTCFGDGFVVDGLHFYDSGNGVGAGYGWDNGSGLHDTQDLEEEPNEPDIWDDLNDWEENQNWQENLEN